MIAVRNQFIARIALVTTLASTALPALLITMIFAGQSGTHAPGALIIFEWASLLSFHGAFEVGQWIGFAAIALIILLSAYLALQPGTRSWVRLGLGLLIAASVSAGAQGFEYQQQRIALAAANWALCPSANPSNPAARDLRAALDARIAAIHAGQRFRFRTRADDIVARFIPAGTPLAKAQALAKDAGLTVYTPARFRSGSGPLPAFAASCDYDAGPFAAQAISVDVYQGANEAGQAVVSRIDAAIIDSAL